MDIELYKQTIEKSIVLDLFDGTSLNVAPGSSGALQVEEEKSSAFNRPPPKDSQSN